MLPRRHWLFIEKLHDIGKNSRLVSLALVAVGIDCPMLHSCTPGSGPSRVENGDSPSWRADEAQIRRSAGVLGNMGKIGIMENKMETTIRV